VTRHLVKRAFGAGIVATCRRPLVIIVLTAAVLLMSLRAFAEGQTGASPPHDIPGPNPLWFLEPLMPRSSNPSTSMDPVAIDLTNGAGKVIALRVPRAYIAQVSQPREIAQSFINLAVYLPDYLPRFLADRAGHKTRGEMINRVRLRSEDEIEIAMRVTAPGTIAKFIESKRSNRIYGGTSKDTFDLYYDVYQPPHQASPVPRRESGYLIPQGRDDLIINFATNLKTSEMLGCRMEFELGDLDLQVAFSSKHLDQYTTIRDRVSELVRPFIVK
jgi:hypothetical protein